ncbi:TRAP transporter substrate-binding protein [Siccirubricoccus phaeus]|uniref:TRAP transporter substrate-binding protein n=1 Tax=Siccirubricoccus phaeus TaxID=2595053 RepID=UPI0011F177A5|nr:TRAP transporter substrate-binding protein DctP [Siccirubricoccus phaeus]
MNRRGLLAAGAAGTALATPKLASAQPQVMWRLASSFPKSTDVLWGVAELLSRRVAELTGGAFQIRIFAAGELVPALQVLDAVGGGNVECGHTAAYYYIGKDPSMGFGTEMPFGMNARQHLAWIQQGGGREVMEEVYRDQGVVALPSNNTGAQMGGWFRKELRTAADLQGLKFRIGGTGGMVLQKLGVVAQQLGATDIYPALERGVIDGAEWVGPHDDEKLGFHRVAQYYYYPGWWEPCSEGDILINTKSWEALPKAYQQVLEAVVGETNVWSIGRYDALNVAALRRLVAGGAKLRPYSREILMACHKATQETYAEIGDGNPRFKRVHAHWDKFRRDTQSWFRVAEDSSANFLALAERA